MKLEVHITPNASRNEIIGWTDDGKLKMKIQSPPVDGSANKGLIRFLAGLTGIPKSKIRIIRGDRSRNKLLEIDGDENAILRILKGNR